MPMAAVTLALTLGIALSRIWKIYDFTSIVSGALLLIAASGFALYRNKLSSAWIAAIAAIICCGLLLGFARRDSFHDNDIRALLSAGLFLLDEPLAFEGCVAEEGELRETDSVTTVEFRVIQLQGRWTAVRGNGILSVNLPTAEITANQTPVLMRGDRVRGWAVWRQPRNYENPGSEDRVARLARRGIFVTGRAKSFQLLEILPRDCAGPIDRFANTVRGSVRNSLAVINPGLDRDGAVGQRRAILASIIIGDYSDLSVETRETFQNAGSFHVLVVSGLHVACIAEILFFIFSRLFIPERVCRVLTATAVYAYACVVGPHASVARCLWVFILFSAGRLLFRKTNAMNILFAAALILLTWNPDWLMETGFQLSFLSVAAIILTASPIIEGFLRPLFDPLRNIGNDARVFTLRGRKHRIGRLIRTWSELFAEAATDRFFPWALSGIHWLLRKVGVALFAITGMIVVSVSVQIWIEPLLAYYYNRLSWIGPLANIVVVPLASIALATGIAGAVMLPLGIETVAALAGSCAGLLSGATEWFARIPGAWQRCPTLSGACVLAGIILFLLWWLLRMRGQWVPCIYAGSLLACAACGIVPLPESFLSGKTPWSKADHVLKLTFLDVGQGDAIVIKFPNGLVRTLDSGGSLSFQAEGVRAIGFDVGEAVVGRYLWHEWANALDSVAISHTHSDHAGGVPALLRNFRVKRFDYAPVGANHVVIDKLRGLAISRKIPENNVTAGMMEQIGGVAIQAIHPPGDFGQASENESSLVFRLIFGRFSALLTGDLERSGEADLLRRAYDLDAQLLKVGHHGGRSATSDRFLEMTRPRWAVISAGRNNTYGHPSPETLTRLKNHGARTFVTMEHGAVTYETDGERYVIRSHVYGIMEQGSL